MNIIYGKESIEALHPYFDIVQKYPNPPTATDGPIKWASIIEAITLLGKTGKVLDIGSGNSALPIMLKDLGMKVMSIDRQDMNPYAAMDEEIETVIGDAFAFIESLEDNSLDYAIDSCAVTHFDTKSELFLNEGWYKIGKLLDKKLKPNGIFITSTDCLLNNIGNAGEFLDFRDIIDILEFSGLKFVGQIPKVPSEPYDQNYNENGVIRHLGIARLIFTK